MSQLQEPKPVEYDSVFLNSRREAIIIFCVWVVCLLWSVPVCYLQGYPADDFDPAKLSLTFGIPTWLFWGIGLPWVLADVFTTWFCFAYMQDDDLGQAADEKQNEALAQEKQHEQQREHA